MDLHDYFENTQGRGILATSDSKGLVDAAVYARPHFVDEDTCAFLMADRLTHTNLQDNPHAAYLFMEQSKEYAGKRLYLTKVKELKDKDTVDRMRRKERSSLACEEYDDKKVFVVYFHVDSIRPLIGDSERAAHSPAHICPTCQQEVAAIGHLCVPVQQEDEKCDWCGALMVDERHLCNDKVKELAYYCNSCGRAAVQAEHLCHPQRIDTTM